jgi:CBS domain-containing protein
MSVLKTELRAKDVMTAEPVCVGPDATVVELARLLDENEISGAPVVDQDGVVIGIVSKTDLVRRASQGSGDLPPAFLFETLFEQGEEESPAAADVPSVPDLRVEDFMTEDPLMVAPDIAAATVAHRMFEQRVHRVIVVDEEKRPVGIITSLDLLGTY